jgi:WD40 repeat protein
LAADPTVKTTPDAATSPKAEAAPATDDSATESRPLLALDTGGHTNLISKLLLNQYGDQLISASFDKTIRFWDVQTGEPLRVLRPPIGTGAFGYIYALALSPDGTQLAIGGYRALTPLYDHRVLLVSLPEGRLLHSLKGHAYAISGLAFSPDGKQLASSSLDQTLRLWDTSTGESLRVLRGHTNIIHGVAWSPDGQHLVSGSTDMTARVWSAETGATEHVLSGHRASVTAVAWRPDGVSVATGSDDHSIRLWSPEGAFQYQWANLPNNISSLSFSKNSHQLLYTFCSDNDVSLGAGVLQMIDGKERTRFTEHLNGVTASCFFDDNKTVATGDSISSIFVWNSADGRMKHRLEGRGRVIDAVGWSPDGRLVAWGNMTQVVHIGDPPIDRTFSFDKLDFGPSPDPSYRRAIQKRGNEQLGPMNVRTAQVMQGLYPRAKFTLPQNYDLVRSQTFLPGPHVAIGSSVALFFLNSQTGQVEHELSDHGEIIWALAPSPNGKYLLTGGNDQILKVWSLERHELLLSLFVAGDEWIAWTPQGYYAASVGGENLMGWHINRGPNEMASFYPAARFHNSLYRPDIVRRVLEAGSGPAAEKLANATFSQTTEPVVLTAVLPPMVKITSPAPRTTIDSETVKLRVTATPAGHAPITSLRVLVDGRPGEVRQVTSQPGSGDQPAAAVSETFQLKLSPGDHRIAVKADTAASNSVSEPLEVSRRSGGDNREPGVLYVLAIGVTDEAHKQATRHTMADARALAGTLAAQAQPLFQRAETRVLTGQQATRAAVLDGLAWLENHTTPADVAVVFFGGPSTRDGHGDTAWLPFDGRADDTESSITSERIKQAAQAIRGKLLMIFDVSGNSDALLRTLLTDDFGAAILSATTGDEISQTIANGSEGLFMHTLLAGLRGAADSSHNGLVHLNELERYVTDEVRSASAERQHARAGRASAVRSFPLATSPQAE